MMIRIGLIVTLAVATYGAAIGESEGKIVNGDDVYIENYPYQISLQHYGLHRCGGTIIGKRFVITAAHCTDGTKLAKLTIRAGSTFREIDGQVVQVAKIYQHPEYDKITKDYDIAVLELQEDITNSVAKVIGLVGEDYELPFGELADVSGWGLTSEHGKGSQQLRALKVPILSIAVCKKAYGPPQITKRMMCAGFTDGSQDTCQGDSGGPLVYNNKLIGVVSFGRGCARPGFPGVYASVSKLRSYIKDVSGI